MGKMRTARCRTCGVVIRPREGQGLISATWLHYWREHPETLIGNRHEQAELERRFGRKDGR